MRRISRLFIAGYVLFLSTLVACTTIGEPADYARKVDYSCATAATAINILTVANKAGKLDVDQQRGVLAATRVTTPICGAATRPTLTEVEMNLLISATTLLQTRAAGVR